MTKLFYGNGNCNIRGSNITAIKLTYRGSIDLINKTKKGIITLHKHRRILIFSLGKEYLNNLFDYEGFFKVTSLLVIDNNLDIVMATVHAEIDYSELIKTNSEDLTRNSEDINSDYAYGNIQRGIAPDSVVNDLHTSDYNDALYTIDNKIYSGYFHIHLNGGAMTLKEHTLKSQNLYQNIDNGLISISKLNRLK
tara:strand:+ start:545 stop:1126 length:582 start_codon:yes stop_codon:yes gene_type:complete